MHNNEILHKKEANFHAQKIDYLCVFTPELLLHLCL